MPRFRWKGRGPDGQIARGEIEAATKEDVAQKLREVRIMVMEILEYGSGEARDSDRLLPQEPVVPRAEDKRPRPLRGLLIALAFVAGAFAVGAMAPVITFECNREAGGGADCTIRERILGIYTVDEQSLTRVTGVEVESSSSSTKQRIVLHNAEGISIRPNSWSQSGDEFGKSTDTIERALSSFLGDTAPGHVRKWQGQSVPLIFAGILLLIAALVTVLSILGMFAGPTKWIQDRSATLAADLEKRKANLRP